jgi:hypothetical protein
MCQIHQGCCEPENTYYQSVTSLSYYTFHFQTQNMQLRTIFKKMDKSGDGELDSKEFTKFLHKVSVTGREGGGGSFVQSILFFD